MLTSKIKGLMVVKALKRSSLVKTSIPTDEIAAAVMAGTIVVVKNAFDAWEMRRLRSKIVSENIPIAEPQFENDEKSWRDHQHIVGGKVDRVYEASFFALSNPDDAIARTVSATAERLAEYWRSLTGHELTFVTEGNRRALRPWAMYYPAGGGCFGWHQHKLEPTKIGLILALSQAGVDFRVGGTEFRTPFGLVDVMPYHDIGDICLFRYDLKHRVAEVDPDDERRWDGLGRWTFIIQGDSRPPDGAAA